MNVDLLSETTTKKSRKDEKYCCKVCGAYKNEQQIFDTCNECYLKQKVFEENAPSCLTANALNSLPHANSKIIFQKNEEEEEKKGDYKSISSF